MSWVRPKGGFLPNPPLSRPLFTSLSSSSSSPASLPDDGYYQKQLSPPPSSGSKLSPAILLIIVILAVIFFISGLLHLLVKFLVKRRPSSPIAESNRYPEMSESDAFQRQLQQLFHLHDSGLDQAVIDALPVFLYKEIVGLTEPFDCAVCLCEFSKQDKLRLLPMCSHAFHIDCIDTWLLCNSTCPLCRGNLYSSEFSFERPVLCFEDAREEDGISNSGESGVLAGQKPSENAIVSERRVFSIRLGKFRSANDGGEGGEAAAGGGGEGGGGGVEKGEGETSSSNLDARRCFSMGSYQYVVADSELQVAVCPSRVGGSMRFVKGRGQQKGNPTIDGDVEAKKINFGSKGESFSVSKIWQWSKKSKLTSSAETQFCSTSSAAMSLPSSERSQGA